MSIPASKDTLHTLSQNIKGTMKEVQNILPTLIELEKRATNNTGSKGTISSLIAHVQNLLLGSYFIIIEIASLVRNLIDTDNDYEKRFYIRWLNHSLFEGYIFFCKKNKEDIDGVWLQTKSEISELKNSSLDNYIKPIDDTLENIKQNYCDWKLRNATAHFSNPLDEYKNLLMFCGNEEKMAQGASSFMSLHMKISQFCTILIAILQNILPKQDFAAKIIVNRNKTNSIIAFINNKVFEACNGNEQLHLVLNKTLDNCTKELNNCDKYITTISRIDAFTLSQSIKFKQREMLPMLHQLCLIRMTIAFMKGDLVCSVKSYLHSEDNIERASNLRRINLAETAILTKLYGYNESKRALSLWAKLQEYNNDSFDQETCKIELELKNITGEFNSHKRNLDTHYREGEKLNIVERYEEYGQMIHEEELLRCTKLINLCNDIDVYTVYVIDSYKKNLDIELENDKKRRFDMSKRLHNLINQSENSEENKDTLRRILDQKEKQIDDMFEELPSSTKEAIEKRDKNNL